MSLRYKLYNCLHVFLYRAKQLLTNISVICFTTACLESETRGHRMNRETNGSEMLSGERNE